MSTIEMNDKTTVEVDFWENQTYKSLQGSWSVPIYGIQRFSDATGKINFKQEKVANDSVYLPMGWEWCDKAWVVDHSGKYGEVDVDGWSYAATIESLVESTRLHALKADRSTGNINRRRRWIRNRRCIILDVVQVHLERVEWAEGVRSKMKEVQDGSKNNFTKLNDYYSGQKDAVEKVIIGTDNTILEVIHEFNELNERLLALKTFLLERGAIEESYAQKLDLFSKKWISEGDAKKFTPAPGAAQPSPHLLTGDPNVDIFAPEGSATAFWNSTTSALKSAATNTSQQVASTTASAATMAVSAATVVAESARRMSDFDMGSAYGGEEPSFESSAEVNGGIKRTTSDAPEKISSPDAFTSANPMAKKTAPASSHSSVAVSAASGTGTVSSTGSSARGASILDEYYYSVCLANRTTGQRLHSYAQLLTHILPQQVDGILEVVREAAAECRHEGREIRSCLMANCRTTDQCFNTYVQSFELSQVELRADSNLLRSAVYQSSATIDSPLGDTSAASLSALAGSYGDASVTGDAVAAAINRFSNLETQDLWLAIQMYFNGANSVDSVLLMYHAFSKMQLRKLRDISATIDELLQQTLRTFSSDQFRAWEDCSSALAALGFYKDILVLQSKSSDEGESSPSKHKSNRIVGANAAEINQKVPLPGEEEDGDDAYESSGRNNASVFRSHFFSRNHSDPYIAYHGRVSYCTTTRAEAHAGGQDYSEHSMWTEVSVLITYNRVMHIMQIPHDHGGKVGDELKFVKENLIMSVNVRNVLVRPLNIPREGYRDAFEVLLAGSASKKLSLLGSLSASSKGITAIMFLTEDTFQMRSWMRAISNPFTDPSKDPPDAVPTATGSGKDGSASPGASSANASSPRHREESDFSFGGSEDMVSGTNSLRDVNRTRAPSSAPPPSSPSTPSTADRFTNYSGTDAVNGTNALRKLKKTPSSSGPAMTGSLTGVFNAAAATAGSAVSGAGGVLTSALQGVVPSTTAPATSPASPDSVHVPLSLETPAAETSASAEAAPAVESVEAPSQEASNLTLDSVAI